MAYPNYTEPDHISGPVGSVANTGAWGIKDNETEGSLKLDISSTIGILDSNESPLLATITNVGKNYDSSVGQWKGAGINKEVTGSYKFQEFTDFLSGTTCKVSETYAASGAVTVTVTGAGDTPARIFVPGDVVVNDRTGERMRVATVPTDTTFTVIAAERAFGTTIAAAGAGADVLTLVASAHSEFSTTPNANATQKSLGYNVVQNFNKAVAISDIAKASENYTGDERMRQITKKGIEHARDIERAFILGEKKETTDATTGMLLTATGGIREGMLTGGSYVQDQTSGTLSVADTNAFIREGNTYGSQKKDLYAGGNVLAAIQLPSLGQIKTEVGDTTYGVKVYNWMSVEGEMGIVKHPMLVGSYAGEAMLLDVKNCFKYRYMKGLDTSLFRDVQDKGLKGSVDEYRTTAGLQRTTIQKCAMLKGVMA